MQPIHSVEYELTSELATEIQRTLLRWELRRGWRQDLPVLVGALVFAAAIVMTLRVFRSLRSGRNEYGLAPA